MKRKLIEKIPEKRPEEKPEYMMEKRVTAQLFGNYLILDLWKPQIDEWVWVYRHVTDTDTGEYASLNTEYKWTEEGLAKAFGDYWTYPQENIFHLSAEDKALIKSVLKVHWSCDVCERIHSLEQTWGCERRERKEDSRLQRIQNFMDKIPDPGEEV